MMPLRNSHVVFYAAVVTLTVMLVMTLGLWFIRRQMLTGNDFLLDAESKEIVARVQQITPPIDGAKLDAALREHTEVDEALFFFQVHDPSGKNLFRSPNLGKVSLMDLTGGPENARSTTRPWDFCGLPNIISGRRFRIAMSLGIPAHQSEFCALPGRRSAGHRGTEHRVRDGNAHRHSH